MKLWKSEIGGKESHYFRTEKMWVSALPAPPQKKIPITGKEPANWLAGQLKRPTKVIFNWFLPPPYASQNNKNNLHASPFEGQDREEADTQAPETWLPSGWNPVSRAGRSLERLLVAFLSGHGPFRLTLAHVSPGDPWTCRDPKRDLSGAQRGWKVEKGDARVGGRRSSRWQI